VDAALRCEPQLAGDPTVWCPGEMNLDSVFSFLERRTLGADCTVRWEGMIYRVKLEHIASEMRGACVHSLIPLKNGTFYFAGKRKFLLCVTLAILFCTKVADPVWSGISTGVLLLRLLVCSTLLLQPSVCSKLR